MAIKDKAGLNAINTARTFLLNHYGLVLIFLAPLILFGPKLVSGEVIFWGTPIMQFVPWREFAIESLFQGHIPLWNPWLGMGTPLVANYQSAIFYPPNWILLVTGSAWGHGFLVMLHVMWTGIGMLLFVRQIGLGKLSQAVAALSFSLSGYVIARAGFLTINAAVAWIPWIILAAERLMKMLCEKGGVRRLFKPILILSLVLCMQWLAGHAQTAWYTLILLLVWVGWRSFTHRREIVLFQAIFSFGVALILAFLLSAVQLLPTAEFLFYSHRASEVERELALAYSFWPWRILGLIMPNLFGNPSTGDYWGYANFWEDAIYIGLLPLILAIFAILRGIRDGKFGNFLKLLSVLAIGSLLLALGQNTPIFPFLYEHIPTFDLFQAPTRWTILLEFSLVLMAAIGVELWQQRELLRLFWVRLGTVGAMAAGIIALLGGRVLSDVRGSFINAVAFAGLWVMLSGVIAWRRRIQPAMIWPVLIASFVAVDLLWAGNGLNPTVSMDLFRGDSKIIEQVTSDHRVYMPGDMEEEVKFEWTHRFDTFYPEVEWRLVRDVGLPNTTMLDKIPSANNFDPILPELYVTWMDVVDQVSGTKRAQLLAMMDVGWEARLDTREEFTILYSEVQNPNRILFVGDGVWVRSNEEALDAVLDMDFNHTEQVILEGIPTRLYQTNPEGSTFSITDQTDPNRLQIKVEATEACWLVVADSWSPDWRAKIDGESVELYRANYLFRAVQLRPGEHMIDFIYKPISFVIGGFVSLISWVLLWVTWWVIKKR